MARPGRFETLKSLTILVRQIANPESIESNPMPDEPPLNVYHYVLIKHHADGSGFIIGPFRDETALLHWSTYEQLKQFIEMYL
mgnify:CR=1 FL=1